MEKIERDIYEIISILEEVAQEVEDQGIVNNQELKAIDEMNKLIDRINKVVYED